MGASEYVQEFTEESFDEGVSQGVVLVDFYADWCGPCRMLSSVIEELAQEMNKKLVFAKIDADQATNIASRFEITAIPTVIIFKEGQPAKRIVGLKDIDSLRKTITEVL